jgi:hypothetical protein
MEGKYLITTEKYFTAPDGLSYQAVWGDVKIVEDAILGVKTNRNSANWYAVVGGNGKEIIIAGCEEKPNTGRVMEWHSSDNGSIVENERPTKIYIAQ